MGERDGLTFQPEAHLYFWRGEPVPSVTQVMGLAGWGPDYEAIPRETLERKGRIGTAVHLMLDAELSGEELEREEAQWRAGMVPGTEAWAEDGARVERYVAAGRRFLSEMPIRVQASERRLYSEVFQYAGTVDVVALMGATRGVYDWKTTSVIHRQAVGVQTTGYRVLWNERHPNRRAEKRYAVQLKDDASWELHPLDDPADERRWMEAVHPEAEDPVVEQARRMVAERAMEFT